MAWWRRWVRTGTLPLHRTWLRRAAIVLTQLVLLLGPSPGVAAAPVPPPEIASYTIEARYTPATHIIEGEELASYHNRTDEPITDLVFHLYLNAFRSEDTLWMREAGPVHRGYRFTPDAAGWIEIDEISLVDGAPLTVEPIDDDATLVRAALTDPVAPGEAVTVAVAFTAQLPRVFARTGWADEGDFVMAGQWFPKFGVWEDGAWTAHPFHANSEFYADFGTYEVALNLPPGWVVGATGVAVGAPSTGDDGFVTHRFRADHVIDFAWSASPHFEILTQRAEGIDIDLFHYSDAGPAAERVMAATTEALDYFGAWYGPYGMGLYPELTIILVPPGAGGAGGMEYPTLFTVGAVGSTGMPRCFKLLEAEAVHELGHQWFQSVVATNEAEEPWLDEGFTEYSTVRGLAALYDGAVSTCGGWTLSYLAFQRLSYAATPRTTMAGAAWEFDGGTYGVATYSKPAVALTTLERRVGEPAMLDFLQTYYQRYAFAHPSAEDARTVMAETLGDEVAAWFFDNVVYSDDTLDARVASLAEPELVREGELCVPVPVRLVEPEEVTLPRWPCDAAFDPDADDVSVVEIDPNHVALLDLNLANNGRRAQADWASWLGLVVRALRVAQTILGGGGP